MKDIQHYKDEVAKENGYNDWNDLLLFHDFNLSKEIEQVIDEAMKRYAEDMCKEQLNQLKEHIDGYWKL